MKRFLKIAAIAAAAVFVIIQFFQIDKQGAPVVQAQTLQATVAVPADVSQILARSCNDCHTNATNYPWYASVQPFGWFLKSHIDDGRRHLNFSTFSTYEPKKREKKLEEICEMVESREMPLPSYLWIHGEAALSDSDIRTLCDWAKRESDNVER